MLHPSTLSGNQPIEFMKKKLCFCLAASFLAPTAFGQLKVNEVDSNTPGTDVAEFVEIFADSGTTTALDGYVVVFFNGSNDQSYAAFDLDGFSTDANGFFVLGNVGVPNVSITFNSNLLQNGADAVAIYTGNAIDFPNGTAVTAVNLIDGLVYDTSDPDDVELAVLAPVQINENENGEEDNQSVQRNPDGSSTFSVKSPTPGTTNFTPPLLELSLDPTFVSETDGMAAIEAEILLPSAAVGDLVVSVSISDGTELAAPVTVTVPSGSDFVVFEIDAVDDSEIDGVQTVDVTVSAPGFTDATVTVLVSDDETVVPDIVINELQLKGRGLDPQFVELYNFGTSAIDLAGWSVRAYGSDSGRADFGTELGSFTIPTGTPVSLSPGGFYLVGNSIFESVYGITPDLQAEPGFGLFDVTVILFDSTNTPVFTVFNTDGNAANQPNNAGLPTVADITTSDGTNSAAGYYLETDGGGTATILEFEPIPSASATPGTTNTTFLSRLRVAVDNTNLSEAAGAAAATATITRVNDSSGALTVTVTSSDLTELTVDSATVEFLAGETEKTVTLTAVDDSDQDGLQSVTVTASGVGFISGSTEVTVSDDDSVPLNLVINEMIVNSAGQDTEFLEIYNADSTTADLAGYTIEMWESDAGQSGVDGGGTIDFPVGAPILLAPGGYFVVANSTFITAYPNVTVGLVTTRSFENSSSTIVLRDASGSVVYTVFATDGGAGDAANINGTPITPDAIGNAVAFALLPDGNGSNVVALDDSVPSSDATPGTTNGVPPVGDYAVTIQSCSYAGGQFTIGFTASGASDVYVTTDLEIFAPATNGAGVASGTYTDTAPPAGKAFYLIQEAGSQAP